MKTKLHFSIVCALLIALSACSSKLNTSSRQETPKVPISINIRADKSVDFTNLNSDFYRLKIKDFLDDLMNRRVELVLVEKDENAEVILDIDVKNFHIFPKKESSSTRQIKRSVPIGTDAKGQPLYQTYTATVYSESTTIPSSARLSSKFTFKDPSYKVRPEDYFARYTWRHGGLAVDGDQLAFGPSGSGGPSTSALLSAEPVAEELLFKLSGEMLARISNDLRRYSQKFNN